MAAPAAGPAVALGFVAFSPSAPSRPPAPAPRAPRGTAAAAGARAPPCPGRPAAARGRGPGGAAALAVAAGAAARLAGRGAGAGARGRRRPRTRRRFFSAPPAAGNPDDTNDEGLGVAEFRQWLEAQGYEGLDLLSIRNPGTVAPTSMIFTEVQTRTGVRMRRALREAKIDAGTEVLRVPWAAMLRVPLDCEDPALELTWKLLEERRLGAESKFAPYVDFLWAVDLSVHPLFWDEGELEWLRSVRGAFEMVGEYKRAARSRAERLRERAEASGTGWEPTEDDLAKALCLVQARSEEVTVPGVDPFLGLIPLIDHMVPFGDRYCPILRPTSFSGTHIPLACGEDLVPCTELRWADGKPRSNARVFAQKGQLHEVPNSEAMITNLDVSVPLPVFVTEDIMVRDSSEAFDAKLQVLIERAGLDLRDLGAGETKPEGADCLNLPADFWAAGRLFPLARFLVAAAEPGPGQTARQRCEELYDALFPKDSDLTRGDLSVESLRPAPEEMPSADGLPAEVLARKLVTEWCKPFIDQHEEAVGKMRNDVREAWFQEERDLIRTQDFDLQGGDRVRTHFKAKGPGGQPAKSKSTKEGLVASVANDGTIIVQFDNGVRHGVPKSWVAAFPLDGKPRRHIGPEGSRFHIRQTRAQCALALCEADAQFVMLVLNCCLEFVQEANKDFGSRWEEVWEQIEAERQGLWRPSQREFQALQEQEAAKQSQPVAP